MALSSGRHEMGEPQGDGITSGLKASDNTNGSTSVPLNVEILLP